MLYHKSHVKHDPANGKFGDCYRTCVAMMLNKEVQDVPHFYHDGSGILGNERIDKWLSENNLARFEVAYPGELSVTEVCNAVAALNPNIHYMLGGQSVSGVNHVVVCYNDSIKADPSWFDVGLSMPYEDNGFKYWLVIIFVTAELR